MASSEMCPDEYLIGPDYLLVWFNMACIMKRRAATSNMLPDSSREEPGAPVGGTAVLLRERRRTPSLPSHAFHLRSDGCQLDSTCFN